MCQTSTSQGLYWEVIHIDCGWIKCVKVNLNLSGWFLWWWKHKAPPLPFPQKPWQPCASTSIRWAALRMMMMMMTIVKMMMLGVMGSSSHLDHDMQAPIIGHQEGCGNFLTPWHSWSWSWKHLDENHFQDNVDGCFPKRPWYWLWQFLTWLCWSQLNPEYIGVEPKLFSSYLPNVLPQVKQLFVDFERKEIILLKIFRWLRKTLLLRWKLTDCFKQHSEPRFNTFAGILKNLSLLVDCIM